MAVPNAKTDATPYAITDADTPHTKPKKNL